MYRLKRIYKIDHIIESVINGQLEQAKQQLQHKCKSKPEKQAYKLAQVTGALIELGLNYEAAKLINQFDIEE